MNKFLGIFLVVTILVFFGMSSAQATAISFGDSSIYWGDNLSWAATEKWTNSDDNSTDSIGTPNFPNVTSGNVYVDDITDLVTKIDFNYSVWGTTVNAGDLFIDTDADYDWDFIVDETAIYTVSGSSSAKKGVNDDLYVLSNSYYGSNISSYRQDHPVEANRAKLNFFGWTTGFQNFNNDLTTPVYFDGLGSLGITRGDEIIIAFSPTCANDVIYEKVPIPEPATMLLFGFGLVGLAAVGRKRFH